MKNTDYMVKIKLVVVNEIFNYMVFSFILCLVIYSDAVAGIRPVVLSSSDGVSIQIKDGEQIVFSSLKNGAGLLAVQPTGSTEVRYRKVVENNGILSLSGGRAVGLEISESYRTITPELIERTVTVSATSDQRYFLDFGWKAMPEGDFYSFLGEEKTSKKYTPSCSGPEFGDIGNSKVGKLFRFWVPLSVINYTE